MECRGMVGGGEKGIMSSASVVVTYNEHHFCRRKHAHKGPFRIFVMTTKQNNWNPVHFLERVMREGPAIK